MTPPCHEAIAEIVQTHVIQMAEAINTRQFNIDQSPWNAVSRNYVGEPGGLCGGDKKSLEGLLETLDKLTKSNPEFRMEVRDMQTHVAENECRAVVFMNSDSVDQPADGLSRHGIFMFEYKFDYDRWMLVRHQSMPGMSVD